MAMNNEMTEPQQSRRSALTARMQKKHPERSFEDDEELYGAIDDDYNERDEELDGYKKREQGIVDVFDKDPKVAALFDGISKGGDFFSELMYLYGDEIQEVAKDPEAMEEVGKKLAERRAQDADKKANDEAAQEKWAENWAKTVELLDEFENNGQNNPEDVRQALDKLSGIIQDYIDGTISEETLQMMMGTVTRDRDIEGARNEGELMGRNAQISEKLRKPEGGASLPNLGGAGAKTAGNRRKSIFDLANEA